jgi:hypothetical protein
MPEINEISTTLLNNGIYRETLFVIYSLPLLITIINFFKYIVGTKTIGTYAPILIVYIFWSIAGMKANSSNLDLFNFLSQEVLVAFTLMISVFGTIALSYSLFYKIKLHYLPKISIVLIMSIIAFVIILFTSIKLEFSLLDKISPLVVILILIISEQFLSIYIKSDLSKAIYLFIETFVISVFCYLLIIQPFIINTLFTNPWILLLSLPMNFLIGKFTGLRLTEYIRFYELLTENSDEDNTDTEK